MSRPEVALANHREQKQEKAQADSRQRGDMRELLGHHPNFGRGETMTPKRSWRWTPAPPQYSGGQVPPAPFPCVFRIRSSATCGARHRQGQVLDHVFLTADHATAPQFQQQVARGNAVAFLGALGK